MNSVFVVHRQEFEEPDELYGVYSTRALAEEAARIIDSDDEDTEDSSSIDEFRLDAPLELIRRLRVVLWPNGRERERQCYSTRIAELGSARLEGYGSLLGWQYDAANVQMVRCALGDSEVSYFAARTEAQRALDVVGDPSMLVRDATVCEVRSRLLYRSWLSWRERSYLYYLDKMRRIEQTEIDG